MANTKLPARLLDDSVIPAAYVSGTFAVDTNTLRVDAVNNRVGIGITSPTAKLHVYDGGITIQSPSGSGGRYFSLDNTDTGGRHYGFISTSNAHGSLGGGDFALLDFDVSGNDAARTRLLLDSSGNVGIGQTTPDEKLHISGGGIKVDGEATIASGSGTGVFLDYASDVGRITALDQGTAWRSLRLNAADIQFYIAGGERMRIDTSGNVGIGVTPSTLLSSSYKALQIGLGASIAAHTAAGNAMKIGSNMVYEGTAPNYYDKYLTSATAAKYELDVHGHKWYYAASGTAGNAISWNELMRIDNSGKVGIGIASPGGLPLQTKVSSGDNKLRMTTGSKDAFILELKDATGDVHLGTHTTAGGIILKDNGDVGIGTTPSGSKFHVVKSGSGVKGRFSDGTSETLDIGISSSSHAYLDQPNNGPILFTIGSAEQARIATTGIAFPSGKGLDFSAAPGVTAGTSTVSGSVMKDYEYGSYTPVLSDYYGNAATYSGSLAGWYVKIGNFVQVWLKGNTVGVSGATGGSIFQVSLPYNKASGSTEGAGSAMFHGFAAGGLHYGALIIGTSNKVSFIGSNNNNGSWQWVTNAMLTGSTAFRASISYQAP